MTREAARAPGPELDWQRIEDRVSDPAAQARVVPFPKPSRITPVIGALSLAAAAALALLNLRGAPPEARAVGAALAPAQREIDGGRLAIGTRVEAGWSTLTVRHAGRAAWILSVASRATLESTSERLVRRLDGGRISAEVVPSRAPESFAIDVHELRVAVHGTAFSVERGTYDAAVRVREGIVAVGARPRDGESVHGWVLSAPASGRFDVVGNAVGAVQGGVRSLAASAVAGGAPTEPHARGGVAPRGGSSQDVEGNFTRAERAASSCVFATGAPHSELRVSVRSTLELGFDDRGRVVSASFDPPLSPDAARCFDQRFSRSSAPVKEHVRRALVLTR